MKKLINSPQSALEDSLLGMAAAHADRLTYYPDGRFIARRVKKGDGKVALISGGGSGHEPMHAGFVGIGMLDAACAGQIFTSPTPDQMMTAAEAVDCGAGVIFIVKNYAGDVMNFEMAAEMHSGTTSTIVTDDDVALLGASRRSEQGNRGVAGTVVVEKIVGAAAERGRDIAACLAIGKRVNAATGSMAVALSSCIVPAAGTPTFTLTDTEIELGVGIHGEAGRERTTLKTADELANIFLESILDKINPTPNDPLLLMSNGLGGTPPSELYIFYNSARKILEKRGLKVARSLVGNYCTALEMAGASLTVTKLTEEDLSLWDDPVSTIGIRW
jgi:phosphoenolpyruvate---glycerone phosphotransferase subunit DhaK